MFGIRWHARSPLSARKWVLVWGLVSVLAAAGWGMPADAFAKGRVPRSPAAAETADPELLLIEVYKALAANRLRDALAKADALVKAYPTFHLGHLIYGDLLLMQTRPVTTLGAVDGPQDRLQDLRNEAMVRLKSIRERPDPDLVPRPVLQLRADQKQVLVVDVHRSRLYLYRHQDGQLKFINDYYISQGKLGAYKQVEGDQRTPVGVYYVTDRLPGPRLPDFYGPGALPINYPNEWDRMQGRTGSGIWLHGTPRDSYSRPPLSSDGCVVLTNADLLEVIGEVDVTTPVVISDRVEFVNRAKWNDERNAAAGLLDAWRGDLENMDMAKLRQHYSSRFESERGDDLNTWISRKRPMYTGVKSLSITLRDMSLFQYPGRDNMIVATFIEDKLVGKRKTTMRKRQYWKKEGARWKIVSEAFL
jgi:murein L,D-transpeptidase YafK